MKRILLVLMMSTLFHFANASGMVYYVNPDGSGSDGMSWSTAFKTLEAAQAAVVAPAEVWVKQGTYQLADSLVMWSGIHYFGGFTGTETLRTQRISDPSLTVINGNKQRTVLRCKGALTEETIWDGFTLQNGKGVSGGGAYLRNNATLQNCIIRKNTNSINSGGGVYIATNATDSVKLLNCVISGNTVLYDGVASSPVGGGGVYIHTGSAAAVLRGCTIEHNLVNGESFTSAKLYGGGVFMNDGLLENCIVNANRVTSLDPETGVLAIKGTANGGGVYVMPGTNNNPIVLRGCTITGNRAEISQGGGLMINPYWTGTILSGKVSVVNCKIVNNYARTHGGGVLCDSQNASSTLEYSFANCVFANNLTETQQGGAVFINNKMPTVVKFVNSTVVNNRMNVYSYGGAGIFYNNIPADVTNCVFWGNLNAGTAPLKHHLRTKGIEGNVINYSAFDPRYRESDVSTTEFPADLSGLMMVARSNYNADSVSVHFRNPTNFTGIAANAADSASLAKADWSLLEESGLIDAGATVRTLSDDITGLLRPTGNAYDIGAYEFNPSTATASTLSDDIRIYTAGRSIVVETNTETAVARIYTLTGTLVGSEVLHQGLNTLPVPANQVYIIRVNNHFRKVALF